MASLSDLNQAHKLGRSKNHKKWIKIFINKASRGRQQSSDSSSLDK